MLNRLNILHWICTAADKFSSAFSSKCFCSKEDKILRQLKGYTAILVFLENSEPKNWTRAQILTILKWTFLQTYNSAKTKHISVYCVLNKSFESLLVTYNYSVMYQFWTCAFNTLVHWRALGEVENECTSHNFGLFAIFVPKIIRFGVSLMWL